MFGEMRREKDLNTDLIYKPRGCPNCNQMGYRGRVCIAEVMMIDDTIRKLVTEHAPYEQIRKVVDDAGMANLYLSGLKKIESGITSVDEVLSSTMGLAPQ